MPDKNEPQEANFEPPRITDLGDVQTLTLGASAAVPDTVTLLGSQ